MPCWITLVDPVPGHLWVNIEPPGLAWLWAGTKEMNSKQRVSLAFTGGKGSSTHTPTSPLSLGTTAGVPRACLINCS